MQMTRRFDQLSMQFYPITPFAKESQRCGNTNALAFARSH